MKHVEEARTCRLHCQLMSAHVYNQYTFASQYASDGTNDFSGHLLDFRLS